MSLSDFLGRTPEITIIDFLIENMDMGYSIDEIMKCTELSNREVTDAVRNLLENDIIEKPASGKFQGEYMLKGNDIVSLLVSTVYTHSFTMAEK